MSSLICRSNDGSVVGGYLDRRCPFAIAISMGWVVRSARIQRDAVAAIRKANGYVSYDCHQRGAIAWPSPRESVVFSSPVPDFVFVRHPSVRPGYESPHALMAEAERLPRAGAKGNAIRNLIRVRRGSRFIVTDSDG
jgi:hypothetical protein